MIGHAHIRRLKNLSAFDTLPDRVRVAHVMCATGDFDLEFGRLVIWTNSDLSKARETGRDFGVKQTPVGPEGCTLILVG